MTGMLDFPKNSIGSIGKFSFKKIDTIFIFIELFLKLLYFQISIQNSRYYYGIFEENVFFCLSF